MGVCASKGVASGVVVVSIPHSGGIGAAAEITASLDLLTGETSGSDPDRASKFSSGDGSSQQSSTVCGENVDNPEEQKCYELIQRLLPDCDAENTINALLNQLDDSVVSEINMFVFTISERSVEDLVESLTRDPARYLQLVGNDPLLTSIAKCYAMYAWTASHISVDAEKWKEEQVGLCDSEHTSSESVLDIGRATGYGFALLLSNLCLEAGIQVEIIKGSIRQGKSVSGEIFNPMSNNIHYWNMVKFGDKPYMMDAMMGSGYVSFSLDFIKEFNSYYFAVPTNYSILSHWPERASQQYLQDPVPIEAIQPLIAVDIATLSIGIMPLQWSENIFVSTADPHASIKVKLKQAEFIVKGVLQPLTEEYDENEFKKYVFVEKLDENTWQVHAAIPLPGMYSLNIYLQRSPFEKKLFLSYFLSCAGKASNLFLGYPVVIPILNNSFKLKLLKWNCNNLKSYLCQHGEKGPHSICFRAERETLFHHCITEGKQDNLETFDESEILMCNTHFVDKGDGTYDLLSLFPKTGWWTIHLSAVKISDEDDTVSGYTKLFSYTVFVEECHGDMFYPHIYRWGSVNFASKPIVPPRREILKVPFKSNLQQWICSVSHESMQGSNHSSAAVCPTQSAVDGLSSFQLTAIFSLPGMWSLLAYGRSKGNEKFIASFRLQVSISEPLTNKYIVRTYTDNYDHEVTVADSGIVTFEDNGKPFTLRFTAISSNVEYIPLLKHKEDEHPEKYATFLGCHSQNEKLSEFSLRVLFPKRGLWTIELYARSTSMGDSEYDQVASLNLLVSKPSPGVCYPKVHPSFHTLGMSLEDGVATVQRTCGTGRFKMPFQAPTSAVFLCSVENKEHPEDPQLAYIERKKEKLMLYAVFPKLGEWKMSLFGKSTNVLEDYTQVLQLCILNATCLAGVSYPQTFEGFYQFKIYFAEEDIPLPSTVTLGSNLHIFSMNFYSSRRTSFLHYATVSGVNQTTKESKEARRMTTIVSNPATRLYTIQVNVDCVGAWTIYLFAESKRENEEWIPILKHRFIVQN